MQKQTNKVQKQTNKAMNLSGYSLRTANLRVENSALIWTDNKAFVYVTDEVKKDEILRKVLNDGGTLYKYHIGVLSTKTKEFNRRTFLCGICEIVDPSRFKNSLYDKEGDNIGKKLRGLGFYLNRQPGLNLPYNNGPDSAHYLKRNANVYLNKLIRVYALKTKK